MFFGDTQHLVAIEEMVPREISWKYLTQSFILASRSLLEVWKGSNVVPLSSYQVSCN